MSNETLLPLNQSGRYESLDAFRGITLASMLIANNPGDWKHIFAPWKHAAWHGCTFTDLIFPAFVFIMGVSMPLSLTKRLSKGSARSSLTLHALRRGLILIALGLILGAISYTLFQPADSMKGLRFPGVLQRLGVVSFFASMLLIIGLRARGIVLCIVILLFGYHFAMLYVPVPGYGAGVLELPGNLATYVDDKVFGPHAYTYLKESDTWHDPEGLLSTLPAIASALIGALCGFLLLNKTLDISAKINYLMVCGLGLVMAGWLWDSHFPINKNLWSSSFVVFTAGWSLLGLGASMWLIEVREWRWWSRPFVALGSNPILIFCLVGLVSIMLRYFKVEQSDGKMLPLKPWLYENLFGWLNSYLSPAAVSFSWGLSYIALFSLLAVVLHRFRIFIRV